MNVQPARTLWNLAALLMFAGFSSSTANAQVSVVATIKPVHALVAQVMGDTGSPILLVTGSASPHTYLLKPSDVAKLNSATIVFRMSEAVEPFTVKVWKSLSKASLITLQQAPGVVTLQQREGGLFETDDHDHGHNAHEEIDGHVWLDPANAKAMLDQIAMTLAARVPTMAHVYRANAASAKTRIDALSAAIARELRPVSDKPYIVFHDAYQYFEMRFGMKVAGSITVNPDIPPSGKRLALLRNRISALGATCVFGEPNFDAKVIATITEGTHARSGVLDPEGATLAEGPDLYDKLMRNLATELVRCLAS